MSLKLLRHLVLLLLLTTIASCKGEEDLPEPDTPTGHKYPTPVSEAAFAFPGAYGGGRNATGGRCGKVIKVANLEDKSLPGSLRYAIKNFDGAEAA